jgi:hypothetical protein
MGYPDDVRRLPDPLRAELDELRTLEDVLGWVKERGLRGTAMSVVTQDEYSHDVVVDTSDGSFVAFGVT